MKKIPKIILTAACLLGSITFSCGASSGTKTRQSTGDPDIDAIWMQQGYTIVYGKPSGSTTKQTQPVQPPVKASVAPARAVVQKAPTAQQTQSTSSSASTTSSGTKTASVSSSSSSKAQQGNGHTRQVPIYAFADVHLIPNIVNKIATLLKTKCHVLINGDIAGQYYCNGSSISKSKSNRGNSGLVIKPWQEALRQGAGDLYASIGNHDTNRKNFSKQLTTKSWIESLKNIGVHWIATYPLPKHQNHCDPQASSAVFKAVERAARFDNTLIMSALDSKYRDVGTDEKTHNKNSVRAMAQQVCANQFNQLDEIILLLHCYPNNGKKIIEDFVTELMNLHANKQLIFDLIKTRIIAIGGHEHISQNKQQQIKVTYQSKSKTVGYYSAQSGHQYIEILPDGTVSFKKIQ